MAISDASDRVVDDATHIMDVPGPRAEGGGHDQEQTRSKPPAVFLSATGAWRSASTAMWLSARSCEKSLTLTITKYGDGRSNDEYLVLNYHNQISYGERFIENCAGPISQPSDTQPNQPPLDSDDGPPAGPSVTTGAWGYRCWFRW